MFTCGYLRLRESLRRASRVSGPGPSGSRSVHRAVTLQNPAASEALGRVADRVAAADLPEEAVAGLAAVCLHPLRKKPSGVRPVGAGEALRRVVAKALLLEVAGTLAEGVGPRQLGCGLKGGGEKRYYNLAQFWIRKGFQLRSRFDV